jgi:hypothetical protein
MVENDINVMNDMIISGTDGPNKLRILIWRVGEGDAEVNGASGMKFYFWKELSLLPKQRVLKNICLALKYLLPKTAS